MNKIVQLMLLSYMPLFALSHLLLGVEVAGGVLIEIYTLISIGLLVLAKPVQKGSSTTFKYMFAGLLIYIAFMGVSSIFFGNPYASKILTFLIDAFGDIKFFTLALVFYYVVDDKAKLIRTFCIILLAIAAFNALFVLRDIAIGGTSIHGIHLKTRSGLTVPVGIFDHKVTSSQIMVMGAIAALSLAESKQYRIYYVLTAIFFTLLVFLHVSVKESVAMLICFALYALFISQSVKPVRSALIGIALIGLGSLFATDNPFSRPLYERVELFTSIKTVRTVSYIASVDIANNNFPLGSGAGTFMSKSAVQLAYSPYYFWYNIAFLHGGKPHETFFLYDTYWPKILAQGGWIAFIAFAIGFVVAIAQAFNRYARTPNLQNTFAALSLIFVFISSLATSMITLDYVAPILAVSLGWLFLPAKQQNPKRTEQVRTNPYNPYTHNIENKLT